MKDAEKERDDFYKISHRSLRPLLIIFGAREVLGYYMLVVDQCLEG